MAQFNAQPHTTLRGSPVFSEVLEEHKRIIGAIIIQDMRTRFGRTHLSYLIAILWPLVHMGVMVAGYALINAVAPVGGNPMIFIATGVLPYILCFYPARMMAFSVAQNRQLLSMPIIRPLHLIIGRAILEVISALIVCIVFYFILYILGYDFMPEKPEVAATVVILTIYLGIGLGFFMVIIVGLFGHMASIFLVFFLVGLYISSGIYIPPWAMSETMRSYNFYNPIFNLVEWMRSAYFASYDETLINKGLLMWSPTVLILLGLLGERFLRGKLL